MRIDLTSLAFGYEVLKGGGNPNWATSLGQGHDYKIIESEEYLSMLPGMIYTSVPLSTIKVKLGKGGKQIDGSIPDSPVVMASVFNKVYVNGDLIKKGRFILLITRDDSQSHFGRLRLKYSPSTTYQSGAKQFTNSEFFELARSSLGLGNGACWFVYDISIQKQDELHFAAVVVNKNKSVKYDDAQTLRIKWNKLIPEGSALVQYEAADHSFQIITYGAPGTGKSHKVDGLAKNPDVAACVRTTFHPDSDYATFVGAYKPVMDGEKIAYKFRPQAFMNAYVKAWQEMSKPEADGKVKSVVLVIEEINRGNCAQIFGDLFQLLDRGKGGYSTYPIDADADLATWLAEQFGDTLAQLVQPDDVKKESDWTDILEGRKLALPPNLYIWATMNTSDQSLFPIDSAFKRRWDWEYVPIAKPDKSGDSDWKERKIEVGDSLFDWWDFLSAINGHIAKATESEDKQLGYFFVKADDATGYISAEQFANKVLFYLYGDVFKSYELPKKDCFQQADNTVLRFRAFFYSEKVQEGEGENRVTHRPGDVKLDVVAAFLRGLKWKEKGVKEEPKGGAADANPD